MAEIDNELHAKLVHLGIISEDGDNTRNYNVGKSNYSDHIIQPWAIWIDWNLNPWDADIIKRVLRTKEDTPREEDYKKIIHVCQERLRQINTAYLIPMSQQPINFEEVK